jgi:hypothetical protein
MSFITILLNMLQTGLGSLASYLAAHVLLCLLPAFLIAGALTALMPKEAVTRFLGKDTPKYISYPAAAVGGFVLAVCSCTIMPLFAGIYKNGHHLPVCRPGCQYPGDFFYRRSDRHGHRHGPLGAGDRVRHPDRVDHGLDLQGR